MPRTRKPKDLKNPDDQNLKPTGAGAPEAEEEGEAATENRPSQLDAIRAALADSPAREETPEEAPELPEPEEEPELPAHTEPEAAAAATEPEPEPEPPPPAEEVTTPAVTAPETPAPTTSAWVPPPAYPPPAPRTGGTSSGLALGIVLVVVGVFFLIMRLFDIDLSNYGWPLYVIIPGLTLLVVGFVSLGTGALVPGGIITVTGLVLAYQNATSDWASWAFAWTLVLPGGVGLGLFLQGLRVRDPKQIRLGRNVMFWAALMFMIGFVVFESIFQISGTDYGIVGRAALPVLLIIIGVTLLARSVRSGRSA
ncbi:MAG TPA: hypothetical protein VFL29_07585 [Candidatus Dormibacteraeota bacterium]|nr:hypothetical protein [Candidatus Dormibacteraeota bacterium]